MTDEIALPISLAWPLPKGKGSFRRERHMGYRTTVGIGLLVFAAVGGVLTINSLSNS